ncbi:Aldolase-type TIM barrel [Penicillium sp. DV-2018c]|nr:Aldolase-type TIM barrel [Penicillium sp. DV-2018c]KAJ5581948.1 Aldolase-type TIM barrel [Penicillium sp. DV-2018c]
MTNSKLFTPLRVGNVDLSNRIALAPLTRFRVDDEHVPLPFVKDYYVQRGSVPGTLLITEATLITARAGGYPNVPGIYTDAQITAWKEITDAVHAKGSHIYMQLWALGRVANPDVLASKDSSYEVISSSDTPVSPDSVVPRALTESEISEWIADYAQAARNAIAAGFDGVELHAANGYLIDQFTQDTCNKRTDGWGGDVERRARFAIEATRAVVDAIGAERTGIRFSPFSPFQGMLMDDPKPTFGYLAKRMAEFKLAYVHLVEGRVSGNTDVEQRGDLEFFLRAYGGASPVIIAGGYKGRSAVEAVEGKYREWDVVIAIGRPFISNPDLVFRVKEGIELVPYDREMFYRVKDPKGYVDYGFSEEFERVVGVLA